ncbi:DUF4230 domain-containing protein [Streptococcus oriscaviae]|uniref:DUF4230 domain-containing protein n=1 Tax=Streptococcus oriscaviae TaxID=2781599 RepID=A0ABX7YL19_9STRE|nr:DUF4230 domain-containing protein [Streptococcus oriscaviae]QUE54536.1 DUF4230 domain-containing protein [Streptococcus oriscaviae]
MYFIKTFFKLKVYLWVVVAVLLGLLSMWGYGYLSGSMEKQSEAKVSTTIEYIEQVNELVFLNTSVQKIITAKNYTILFGQEMPFSEKSALLIVNYKAKFGIKSPVTIEKTGEKRYRITVPSFQVIGLELDAKEPYILYDKSGDILSFTTEEIDTGQLVTDEFKSAEQTSFLTQYEDDIKESAQNYYHNLFKSISSDLQLEVVFEQ